MPYDKLSSINSAIKLVTETINSITETEVFIYSSFSLSTSSLFLPFSLNTTLTKNADYFAQQEC